jgi:hypothetical protein
MDENVYFFLTQNDRAAAKLDSNQAETEGIIIVDDVELFRYTCLLIDQAGDL